MTNTFQPGDRVKVVDNTNVAYFDVLPLGAVGTVRRTDNDPDPDMLCVYVDFDNPEINGGGWFAHRFEKVEGAFFKIGDRVKYVGKHDINEPHRMGDVGTVVALDQPKSLFSPGVFILWDNSGKRSSALDGRTWHLLDNLEKLEDPAADLPDWEKDLYNLMVDDLEEYQIEAEEPQFVLSLDVQDMQGAADMAEQLSQLFAELSDLYNSAASVVNEINALTKE